MAPPSAPMKLGGLEALERLADAGYGDAGRGGVGLEVGRARGRDGGDDLIVVAAGERDGEQVRRGGDRGAGGSRQRHAIDRDAGADPGDRQHLGQVPDEAVRDVHAAVYVRGHGGREAQARLRLEIAAEQDLALGVRDVGTAALPDLAARSRRRRWCR